ncbi:MAG: hypothetical protein IPM83_16260 [Ignavibacteria bacterium]|nr:hypothetical protein [Ignavibacteria bacterium]
MVADTIHGTIVTDPYRWLENDRDPEVEAPGSRTGKDYRVLPVEDPVSLP